MTKTTGGRTQGARDQGRTAARDRKGAVEEVPRAQAAPADASPAADDLPEAASRRVIVEHVRPSADEGRFPVKRTVGEEVDVHADVFADGHDVIAAVVRDRPASGGAEGTAAAGQERRAGRDGAAAWRETAMTLAAPGTDEWTGRFVLPGLGWHEYLVEAWIDHFRSWRRDLRIKADAGQSLALELVEGAALLRAAAGRAGTLSASDDAEWLRGRAATLADAARPEPDRVRAGLDEGLASMMAIYADRSRATRSATRRIWVDRERARVGAWYEMFPRSIGTFREAAGHLPYVADLGFDVVYLPPIHPIGYSYRKGRNNALVAGPGDPGSPWAIGADAGGHTAVEPQLGTIEDFEAFCREATRLGLEVAIDLAWQTSPDHPWTREHPEWFRRRPDGTIKSAENPPKKYQDIYPLDFESPDWRGLWRALLQVTLFWVERGVRIFRVDNPHTKTFSFWEWLIQQVHTREPRVIFLAEAFTRPKPMRYLAKAGFTQSYTYFTWRNSKSELTDYLTELTATEVREYLRPNFFANTPDILHAYLQDGGRPAFEARLLLAATLAANYGIYSGFELCENRAVPGTEEYLDSEKYQLRAWDWDRPGHIRPLIARVNRIRHAEPALQFDWTLRFQATDNPQIIAYTKSAPDGSGLLLIVVNLDPRNMQHGWVQAPPDAVATLTGGADAPYVAHDLLEDARYVWRGEWNYVRLDPGVAQGHVFRLEPKT